MLVRKHRDHPLDDLVQGRPQLEGHPLDQSLSELLLVQEGLLLPDPLDLLLQKLLAQLQ